jgi:hypothetical protein
MTPVAGRLAGRVFLNNRYHDPTLGRFVSVDPMVDATGEPYSYGSNNPVTFADPTGLYSTDSLEHHIQDTVNFTYESPTVRSTSPIGAAGEYSSSKMTYRFSYGTAMQVTNEMCSPGDGCVTHDVTTPYRGLHGSLADEATWEALASMERAEAEGVAMLSLLPGIGDAMDVLDCAGGSKLSCAAAALPIVSGKVAKTARIADAGMAGFNSFRALKRVMGAAGDGMEWHHIVEQTAGNVAHFGPVNVHSTSNVMRLDTATHRKISAYYSGKTRASGDLTVRAWLSGQSFAFQTQYVLDVLQQFGVTG